MQSSNLIYTKENDKNCYEFLKLKVDYSHFLYNPVEEIQETT